MPTEKFYKEYPPKEPPKSVRERIAEMLRLRFSKKLAAKHPPRETAVNYTSIRPLGKGSFGTVEEVIGSFPGRKGKKHKRSFAVKEFAVPEESEWAQEIYLRLKSARARVFPTYRLSREKTKILMTLGKTKKTFCVGSNSQEAPLRPGEQELHMTQIENLDEFLKEFSDHAIRLGKLGFEIPSCSYFFLVDRETQTHLDFILGDLDEIDSQTRSGSQKLDGELQHTLALENLICAKVALGKFLDRYAELDLETTNRISNNLKSATGRLKD